ncbi:hypothetical protein COLO4_13401 [Corchorus olitorius]|uniref:Inhibitor I9 domain-containing protein n=1 Tax=Corchorus olitorius TaxID=93759 RepID=A0A1R3JWM8_9ROSI|nr:hypothetical protein COLO4_13401 [Corchorus olitorius]
MAPSLIYSYDSGAHGFSAVLSPDELETLKNSPGFVSAYPDRSVTLVLTQPTPLNSCHLTLITGYGLLRTMVKLPESDSYKLDDGMTPVPARYLNKGVIAANPGVNISMNSARDVQGHGTHTSSTAGGNYVKDVSDFGYGKGTARGMKNSVQKTVHKACIINLPVCLNAIPCICSDDVLFL